MDKVIPVVVIKDLKDAIPTLQSLKDGGINCAEITFRTACAEQAIKDGVKAFPDMNIGAGTVINLEQAKKAVEAGAKFLVSPGLSSEVALYAKEVGVDY
ncbi:MAG: keto-hydroxyglutarate-aldolase/keto-deoxy-phosphogluconate aldolase, partial [Clostridiales bacterium]|nr:keto-hydroxyglutarate-aldolase/keto-deoxy-phosphogluconate aldolase [Clostridiales bacterium]